MEKTFFNGNSGFRENPCKDCRRRHIGCHGDCPVWRERKKVHDKRADAYKEEKRTERLIKDLNFQSIHKPRRKEKFNWRMK